MPADRATPSHERDAIALSRVLVGAALLVVTLVACFVGVKMLERELARGLGRAATAARAADIPTVAGPHPQPSPEADLAAFNAQKRSLLEGYAWSDRPRGVVRIPIDQAMRLIAGRNAAPGARQ